MHGGGSGGCSVTLKHSFSGSIQLLFRKGTSPPPTPPLTDAQLSASASLPAVGGVLFETLEGLRSDECKLHSGRGFVNLDQ